jgi:hypothetical protein
MNLNLICLTIIRNTGLRGALHRLAQQLPAFDVGDKKQLLPLIKND